MKAMVTRKTADGRREKRLVDGRPDPGRPAANEVVVRTLYTGLTNGTERNDLIGGNYATPDDALPAGMGYQNVGEVIELGSAVTGLVVGDIVYSGTWLKSDHAERVTVPAQDFERFEALIKLPDGVEPQHAALFGVASVAMRVIRAADVKAGEDVLIVGLGGLGQIIAQVAKAKGARVTACDINPARLDLARSIGATDTVLDTSGAGWDTHIKDESFDAVIDVAGVPGMEDRLISAIRVFGRVLFIAGRGKVTYDFNMGQFKEVAIRQIAHFDVDDLGEMAELVASGQVALGPIIRHMVPARDCGAIYDTLRDSPDKLMGVVFAWGDDNV